MKKIFAIGLLVLAWAPCAVAQEPTRDEAHQELTELRKSMQEARRDVELQVLVMDLIKRGASEEKAVELAAMIAQFFGDQPIKIKSPAFGNRAGELDGVDPEKAEALIDQICDFRRSMLEKKLRWIEGRAESSRSPGGCRACLDGVRDCMEVVETIYNNCIESGLSLEYCLDIWISHFELCESQSNECFGACGLPGGG